MVETLSARCCSISAVRSAAILLSQPLTGDSRISAGFKRKSLRDGTESATHLLCKGCHVGRRHANACRLPYRARLPCAGQGESLILRRRVSAVSKDGHSTRSPWLEKALCASSP